MNYQEQYKRRPAGFHDTNDGRLLRAGREEVRRRDNRAQNFARHRDVPRGAEEAKTTRRSDLSARLRRWKEERQLKKKIEQQKKKPVFKVGIVHHNFYSPPINDRCKSKTQRCHPKGGQKLPSQPTPQKRITRATQKRLEARNIAGALQPVVASGSRVSPIPKRSQRKSHLSANDSMKHSFAPANYVFTAPTGITEIPMFGRIAVPDISTFKLDLQTGVEKPLENFSNVAGQPQVVKGRLERSMAVDEPSSPTSVAEKSNQNSSTDFCLRLSTNNESIEETPANDNPPLAEVNAKDIATPPRSGSPVPASFSPYIVTSRGKDSVRKEQKNRMGIRRSSANEIPTKDTVMQSLNISVEEEEQTAQYFKFLLLRETDRLNELCAKWDILGTDPTLSEDAASQIVAAIGQTRLLMRKKFERFKSLIHDCETGKGQMLVRCKDLEGFWDLIGREIKDLDARFLKLESLEANDWIEEEAVVTKITKKKAAPAKTKAKINAKSSARSWILAARKKKMAQDAGSDNDVIASSEFGEGAQSTSRMSATLKAQERKRRTSTPKTPTSLLKAVHLSQASKNIRSPLAVMKVTKMFKTPEVTMDDTISYVNSDQTPGKGILKKSEESCGSESLPPKSARKVDFSDDVFLEFPAADVDEALQNSIDLGRALARIESYDSESNVDPMMNITVRHAEKRLDFEDESFDEAEDTHTAESATIVAAAPEPTIIPNIVLTDPTPSKTMSKKTPSTNDRRSSRRASNLLETPVDEVEEPVSTRVLRNRKVVVETPNNGTRRSTRLSVLDETNTRSTKASKENADPQKGAGKETISELHNVLRTDQDTEDNRKKRRSTRKSVRFNPDDCTACGEAPKPVQPMTPHARRSKKVSLLGDQPSEPVQPLIGDLMCFDTPTKIPPRIQRTSRK